MSTGSRMSLPDRSKAAHSSMRSVSTSDPPTPWPAAARKVKAIPPPTTSVSMWSSSAFITSSLSATLAPPTTATKGRAGAPSKPPSTSTSRWTRSPAALGSDAGGPTTEAWRRWRDPEGVVHIGVVTRSPASGRRTGRRPPRRDRTGGSRAARPGGPGGPTPRGRARPRRLGSGWPSGRPRWVQAVTDAPRSSRYSKVGSAARMRKSSTTVAVPEPLVGDRSGTLKSTRTRTLEPAMSPRSGRRGRPSSNGLSGLSAVTPFAHRHPPGSAISLGRHPPPGSGRPVGWRTPTRCRTTPPP